MKRLIVVLLLMGCVPEFYGTKDFSIGMPKTVTVGSPMINMNSGLGNDQDGVRNGQGFALYYNGIDHNVIQISYREFDITHSQFYAIGVNDQNFKYDLSLSDTVVFQTIKIKVDKADGQSIAFRVLEAPAYYIVNTANKGDVKVDYKTIQ